MLEGPEWAGRNAFLTRAGTPLIGRWDVEVEQHSLLIHYPDAQRSRSPHSSGRLSVRYGVIARAFIASDPPVELRASADGDTAELNPSRLLAESLASLVDPTSAWLGECRIEGTTATESIGYRYVLSINDTSYWQPLGVFINSMISRYASALRSRRDIAPTQPPYNRVTNYPSLTDRGVQVRREAHWSE